MLHTGEMLQCRRSRVLKKAQLHCLALTGEEGLERLQQLRAGGADALRLLQLELGRQHRAQPAAGVAEDEAAQPAVVPQPREWPASRT